MHHLQYISDYIKSTMAVPVWMKNWIGGEMSTRSVEKSESVLVVDALMSELDLQMKDAVRREKEVEKSRQRHEKGVDYSWLISAPAKRYHMSTIEKLELEEMCAKVKPIESGNIIAKFREVLSREPSSREIPNIFRSCVKQILEERRPSVTEHRESLVERVARRATSLTSLRIRASPRVLPVNHDEFELHKMEEGTTRTISLPDFNTREDVMTV